MNPEAEDKERCVVSLKKGINNLIWCYAPKSLTLGNAEELAIKILNMIQDGEA